MAYVPPWLLTFEEFLAYRVPSPIGDSSRNPGSVDELRAEGGTLQDYSANRDAMLSWLGAYLRVPGWSSAVLLPAVLRGEALTVWRSTRDEREIWPGAYVTLARDYARDHRSNALRGEGHLLHAEARPDELVCVNPQEFWYAPRSLREWHRTQVRKAIRRKENVPTAVLAQVRSRVRTTRIVENPRPTTRRAPRHLWQMTREEFEREIEDRGEVRHALGTYRRLGPPDPPSARWLPSVDFSERDNHDRGDVDEFTIARDYMPSVAHRADIYRAWVDPSDVPAAQLAEVIDAQRERDACRKRQRALGWPSEDEEGYEDCDEIGNGEDAYDWESLSAARSTPPAKLLVQSDDDVQILDGNHRVHMWDDRGVVAIPAWVIDLRGHRAAVADAVENGERVPRRVLVDYPDLAKSALGAGR